jgi:alkylhydroperoxidase family enzyme
MTFDVIQTEEGTFLGHGADRQKRIQKLEREARDLKREENKIDRQQRAEVEAAINWYNWMNLLITPTIVLGIGLIVGLTRKLKTAAK